MKNEKFTSICLQCTGEIEIPPGSIGEIVECPFCSNLTELSCEKAYVPTNRSLFSIRKAITPSNQNYWLDQIIPMLNEIIQKTREQIFPRIRNFGLQRYIACTPIPHRSFLAVTENALEKALLNGWGLRNRKYISKPVADCWAHIICNQVALGPGGISAHIARADLLGVSSDGSPSVIELKSEWNSSALLSVFLQALEYAIRVQACWNYLLPELQQVIPNRLNPIKADPDFFIAVCVAPSAFWNRALNPRVPISWDKIHFLRQTLLSHRFKINFVSLSTRTTKNGYCIAAREISFTNNLQRLVTK